MYIKNNSIDDEQQKTESMEKEIWIRSVLVVCSINIDIDSVFACRCFKY